MKSSRIKKYNCHKVTLTLKMPKCELWTTFYFFHSLPSNPCVWLPVWCIQPQRKPFPYWTVTRKWARAILLKFQHQIPSKWVPGHVVDVRVPNRLRWTQMPLSPLFHLNPLWALQILSSRGEGPCPRTNRCSRSNPKAIWVPTKWSNGRERQSGGESVRFIVTAGGNSIFLKQSEWIRNFQWICVVVAHRLPSRCPRWTVSIWA